MEVKIIDVDNKYIKIKYGEERNTYKFIYSLSNDLNIDFNNNNSTADIPIQEVAAFLSLCNDFNIGISDKDKDIIKSKLNEVNELKNLILSFKNATFEDLIETDQNFQKYVKNILNNLNISLDGEYSDITKKQLVKVYVFNNLENVMNFSDPGSGKTLMTLMSIYSNTPLKEKVLIVSPINSMSVWYDEIKRFVNIENNEKLVHFYNSDMHKKFSDMPKKDITDFKYAKFILINYESAKKISENETIFSVLVNEGYQIVFDEAHRVKNGSSTRNAWAKKLSSLAKRRMLLTGTPFSTGIEEVKQMINISWPDGNPFITEEKLERYSEEIQLIEMGEPDCIGDIPKDTFEKLKDLSKDIEPLYFSLNKTKDFNIQPARDLTDSPELVEPLKIQKELDSFIMEKISSIHQSMNNVKNHKEREILEKALNSYYTAAQQNIVNPWLLEEYPIFSSTFLRHQKVKFSDLPKIKKAIEMVEEIVKNGEKVMIWFTFVKNITYFKNELIKRGIIAEEIHGSTELEERKEIIDSFSWPESKIQVLISNPATIAESISLHKSVSKSIFVERTLSYFRWAQAKDRIHRVGSKKVVTNFYIKNDGLKMEEKTFSNLKKKSLVANEILNIENNPIETYFALKKLRHEEELTIEEYGQQQKDFKLLDNELEGLDYEL